MKPFLETVLSDLNSILMLLYCEVMTSGFSAPQNFPCSLESAVSPLRTSTKSYLHTWGGDTGLGTRQCHPGATSSAGGGTRHREGRLPPAHVIALGLEEVELEGDAVLGGGHQLPDAVLVGGILLGPPRAGDGAVELGEETSAGGCRAGPPSARHLHGLGYATSGTGWGFWGALRGHSPSQRRLSDASS